jgi:hypothetical protein
MIFVDIPGIRFMTGCDGVMNGRGGSEIVHPLVLISEGTAGDVSGSQLGGTEKGTNN